MKTLYRLFSHVKIKRIDLYKRALWNKILVLCAIKHFTSVVYFQPMPEDSLTENQFEDATIGMNIPKNFIPSIEKVMMSMLLNTLVTVHGPKQLEVYF